MSSRRRILLVALLAIVGAAALGGGLLTIVPEPCLFTYPDEVRLPHETLPVQVKFQVVLTDECRAKYGTPIGDIINNYFYFWDFGDGKFESTSSSSIMHSYSDYGSYNVQLRVQAKLQSTQWSRTVDIFPPRPLADITVSGSGLTLTFTADVTGGAGPFIYRWFVDGTMVEPEPGRPSITYTFGAPGTYHVFVEISDRLGQATRADEEVTVSEAAPPTSGNVTSPPPSPIDLGPLSEDVTEIGGIGFSPLSLILLGVGAALMVGVAFRRTRLFVVLAVVGALMVVGGLVL